MSPRQTVCGSALNSSQFQLAIGRGPSLIVNLQLARSTRGVGPLARTGKSSVRYWPGGSRRATSSLGRCPENPRVAIVLPLWCSLSVWARCVTGESMIHYRPRLHIDQVPAVQGSEDDDTRYVTKPLITSSARVNTRTALTPTWNISKAPIVAPRNMVMVATNRRAGWEFLPPASDESAAIPVSVNVSTVVVRSGTPRRRAVAFCNPIASASSTMSAYEKTSSFGSRPTDTASATQTSAIWM